ncbi:hypothetical protein DXT88_18995 [Herbaspirillum lusitanum]|nr:hypothetical protein [Herbaspirillum lusitanum]
MRTFGQHDVDRAFALNLPSIVTSASLSPSSQTTRNIALGAAACAAADVSNTMAAQDSAVNLMEFP